MARTWEPHHHCEAGQRHATTPTTRLPETAAARQQQGTGRRHRPATVKHGYLRRPRGAGTFISLCGGSRSTAACVEPPGSPTTQQVCLATTTRGVHEPTKTHKHVLGRHTNTWPRGGTSTSQVYAGDRTSSQRHVHAQGRITTVRQAFARTQSKEGRARRGAQGVHTGPHRHSEAGFAHARGAASPLRAGIRTRVG